ncbi:MAG: lecithin retinol acyltransferase family protein [Snowella sp.]|nr:lecithin retinol acyltransferase family protein [Snowella sp.]
MATGDQIYVYRELWNLEGVYEHHGIDCGDGTVIHYRKPSETVERTSWDIFSRHKPVFQKHYHNQFCFLPEIVVERAQSRLGEQKYNLLFNNCEHFANWCKTGLNESGQIRDFLPFVTQFNPEKLSQSVQDSLRGSDPNKAQRLFNEALGDLREVWNEIQPRYQAARQDADSWQQVAQEALKRDREDLARAALQKKLESQRQANQLQEQLEHLGILAEKILKDSLLQSV